MDNALKVKDFIEKKWAVYADYDNRRSLPNLIDGLKTTQRKVLYTALSLPKNGAPVRVSRFAAKASEMTSYHHGERSMMDTVVKLAQDFPGSNNYPLLEKHGQFGSRLSNESAGARYIETKLHKNWNLFFKDVDQDIVEYLHDDGISIEPKHFIPILPMVLVNGSDGIGNGFRTSILPYDVKSIIKCLNECIKHGKTKSKLIPFVNGFTGEVEKIDKQVSFKGKFTKINTTKIRITELPPYYNNEKYKTLLNNLIESGHINDYENRSTEDSWEWIITCPRATTNMSDDELMVLFGLVTKITENLVGWGVDDSSPITFNTPEELLEYWFTVRITFYEKSLTKQIEIIENDLMWLDSKIKFIKWCLNNDFRKLTKAQFIEQSCKDVKELTIELASEFVNIPMYKITKDEVEKAKNEIKAKVTLLNDLSQKTPLEIMSADLKTFN